LAIKDECPERYSWWISELESLGVSIQRKQKNELNNKNEIRCLAENIKHALYQDYKTVYSDIVVDTDKEYIIELTNHHNNHNT
jgi:hypothetical protein